MLHVKPFKRLMKQFGAKRVSNKAAKALTAYVEKAVSEVMREAALLAEHAGRKTVLASDVRLARKKLNL